MIKETPVWKCAIPSQNWDKIKPTLKGKFLYFGSKEKLDALFVQVNHLVENGFVPFAKVLKVDTLKRGQYVLCVYTNNDAVDKARIQSFLYDIGINTKTWKSNKQTNKDWEDGGRLYEEAKTCRQIEIAEAFKENT
jgi:hypothetical protein